MCLMCEWYYDSCTDPECVEELRQWLKNETNHWAFEELFESRSGTTWRLHKGYMGPCKHMLENHGPECDVVKKHETEYGMIYEECNCDRFDGEWVYY